MTDEGADEARTDHRCVLGALVRQLAGATGLDRAALAAEGLDAMLRAGQFDECCAPRYLALAPGRAARECQIPIERAGDVAARVVVWPVGARDAEHPHTDGWAVFVPVRGELVTVERGAGEPLRVAPLAPRRPVILRPEQGVRHLVRNAGLLPALTVHLFGMI